MLVSAAHEARVEKFIYVSTDEVYGGSLDKVSLENDCFNYLPCTTIQTCQMKILYRLFFNPLILHTLQTVIPLFKSSNTTPHRKQQPSLVQILYNLTDSILKVSSH